MRQGNGYDRPRPAGGVGRSRRQREGRRPSAEPQRRSPWWSGRGRLLAAAAIVAGVAAVGAFLAADAQRDGLCGAAIEAEADPAGRWLDFSAAALVGDSFLPAHRCDAPAPMPGRAEVHWRPAGTQEWTFLVSRDEAGPSPWNQRVSAPACGGLELELRVHDGARVWAAEAALTVACPAA